MPRRTRLRTRVLLLTSAFAFALFAITFGLSWRAHVAQQRWSGMVATGDMGDASAFQQSMNRVRALAGDRRASRAQIERETARALVESQRLVDARRREIARQLPLLDRDTRSLMSAGLAVAWIIVIVSFAAVQVTLRKVVKPIEDLSRAADRIAGGDLNARAPVAGDHEIASLGAALNGMADELRAHARTDELTELPNFRAFRERIDDEIARASRYPSRFGVLVLDLDRFKKYNDTWGHLAGNDALVRVAGVIRDAVRSVDFPARYGGEEFAVIVPQVDVAALAAVAERIRAGVEALPSPREGAPVTISIGGATYPDDGTSTDALFQAADERLYQAKNAGRNRCVMPVRRVASSA